MESTRRDIHVMRYFSSFISVSDGRVIHVTDPSLTYCPLAGHLYRGLKTVRGFDKEAVKKEIAAAIESKIRDFGLFTAQRKLAADTAAIPYGASEMLRAALDKKAVDAAVAVCDGAGTIITDRGEVVQGVGARMNSLLLTSPIKETICRLQHAGCRVVFEGALIDQVRGVETAIAAGYTRIAVTVSGFDADAVKAIRALESTDTEITILVVCTTGLPSAAVGQIGDGADLVWSCASPEVREKIGAVALLQISKQIPVFVLTQRGLDFVAAYAHDATLLRQLDTGRQYLISNEQGGAKITLGGMSAFLREEKLPHLPRRSVSTADT